MEAKTQLQAIPKCHDFFIGFDSDGCVFDSMEIKHKECFCPNFIKHFGLQNISKYARETWEFVNLYSTSRGVNRFLAVLETMERLQERPEVRARNAVLPDMGPLAEWVAHETRLGNPALAKYIDGDVPAIMKTCYEWSTAVNESVKEMVFGIGPFPHVIDVLKKITDKADSIVVSQTPLEALEREWEENAMTPFIDFIAGQEHGTKTEHLRYAAVGKYEPDKILMVGDAPGDSAAADANGVLFYPIIPGQEEDSWETLHNEGLDRFFGGTFAGTYQTSLRETYLKSLPARPPWRIV
jgi:phosphoglycolate phosphatase-like HAD superfamily hydrolase